MAELTVGLGDRSYPIIIEKGCLERIGDDLKKRAIGNRYCVVADDRVAEIYGPQLMKTLAGAGLKAEIITFPMGEANKNLATVATLASQLARLGFDRKDAIIAFGGGVSGDIAGFLASSYMRGIPFVQIPTTLLAQVDSSVGGKTGVDIPEGKNLVGAFYQPKAVYIDIDVLSTLPKEELLGGLGEVIKYGVIRDREFFDYLLEAREAILQLDPASLEKVIFTCCKIKADVVSEDEREGGVRRILNYGHTIGHAVEGASDYSIIHGLAVSIGMVAAANLAVLNNVMPKEEAGQVVQILTDYKMPITVPGELDRRRIKEYLLTDKKTVAGTVFFVLPTTIGNTIITDKVTESQIDMVLG
ncbi:3-dehydroquinate synthase [Desulforhopalus sp. IMCC35007]|uniref:3-dehydroquinate synthase n=1 Tax=Desulforhopalus sp. IMCC35007 TaxID=2569543 RepID=UPI0010ADC0F2|nr:3-dehydroquinate synthase [Desulforhopalus sp. IMCC35007]TKB09373.1 3-dehydroquinate synthase [Desulforhopalus sp. IMCC35007]